MQRHHPVLLQLTTVGKKDLPGLIFNVPKAQCGASRFSRARARNKVEPGAQLQPQLSTGNHCPCRPLFLGLALARQTPWASDTHLVASSINSCTRPDLPETPDKHWLLSGHTAAPKKESANVLYFFPEPELLSDFFLGRKRELQVKVTSPSPPKSFVA